MATHNEQMASGGGDAGIYYIPKSPKFGLEAFSDDLLNRSGSRVISGSDRYAGAVYKKGPFRGLTMGEALTKARDIYGRMNDRQRQVWEAKAGFDDVRSSRERGYSGPEPSGMQEEARKTGEWHSGDGKVRRGFDSASPEYRSQLIGIYGSEAAARAQFGEKPDGRGGFVGPDGNAVSGIAMAGKPGGRVGGGGESFRAPVNIPTFDSTKIAAGSPEKVSFGIGTSAGSAGDFSVSSRVGEPASTALREGAMAGQAVPLGATPKKESPPTVAASQAPTQVGRINGKPASQAIAEATAENDTMRGVSGRVSGTVAEDGRFQSPAGGGDLVGMDGGKPIYEQKSKSYAGPDGAAPRAELSDEKKGAVGKSGRQNFAS